MTLDGLRERVHIDGRALAKTAASILAIAVLVLSAIVVAPGLIGADESYVVLSDSMEPAFTSGDVVIVDAVPTEQIDVGDVITYDSPGAGTDDRISHRVVAIDRSDEQTTFRTKGDQNEKRDQYVVDETDVIGRIWFVIPFVGYFVRFAGTDLGIIMLVVVPGVALVVTELWSVYQDATIDS